MAAVIYLEASESDEKPASAVVSANEARRHKQRLKRELRPLRSFSVRVCVCVRVWKHNSHKTYAVKFVVVGREPL